MYYYLAHIVLMLSTCCADGKHQWCWVQIRFQKVINCLQKCLHKYSLISIKKSKYNLIFYQYDNYQTITGL